MMPRSCAASSASAICSQSALHHDGNGSALDPLGERLAFDEFHHDAARTACLLEPINLSDIGMIQRSQKLRLALKPL